jgi:hypothetical protein
MRQRPDRGCHSLDLFAAARWGGGAREGTALVVREAALL